MFIYPMLLAMVSSPFSGSDIIFEPKGRWASSYIFSGIRDDPYIGSIERGKQNITVQMLLKIADALHVDVSELFGHERSLTFKSKRLYEIIDVLSDKNDNEMDSVLIILQHVFKIGNMSMKSMDDKE
ncbi:helix-turn-helix domain-containing protein [Paenibacillus azoreducens]|uniref:HTH cro/C1-type domain-containing protein n=1 Tax=Paenibacillus azoreducens TaxID=116718 RepID=A0A919YI38_9BACL|nr:helix-turn-helix transcriptional regulator [Paenibacillus azoreducens]GIO50879.1 hypothetical protein J34TS1_56440 [Paenibacillus azoreducens]